MLALAVFVQAQAPSEQLKTLEQQAEAEFSKRDCGNAAKTYQQALAAAANAADSTHVDFFWRRIGICRARLGDLSGALDAYTQGSAASESAGDQEMLAENIHGMALALQKLGRIQEALPRAQREYDLTLKCGHPEHQLRAMWLVAELDSERGKLRASLAMLESALIISRASNNRNGTGILLTALANRYAAMGDQDRALAIQMELLAQTDQNDKPSLAIAYSNLGAMQNGAGQKREAEKSYARSIEVSGGPDGWRVRIVALLNMARLQRDSSRFADADVSSRQALDLAAQMKMPAGGERRAYRFRAEMYETVPGQAKAMRRRPPMPRFAWAIRPVIPPNVHLPGALHSRQRPANRGRFE